jgi:predicted HAD superfamily Cof-like phosphohydrolase
MSLDITALWFKRAVPTPTDDNLQTQLGCHAEEFGEMLENLKGQGGIDERMIRNLEEEVKLVARALKTKNIRVSISDRKEFLDSLADQIVTATGCGHMAGMDVPEALNRVNTSNFSKFDANGFPIFDENGKIAKNKDTYRKADLTGLY